MMESLTSRHIRKNRCCRIKRPYVRKITNNAPGVKAPTSPPQLAELAFNIHGWALEDGLTQRKTFEVINAYRATMIKGGFEAKIRELEKEGVTDIYRQDHVYTARELDTDLASTDPAVAQYLVIGYTLQEDDPFFQDNKKFLRYSDNELVGEYQPSPEHFIAWDLARAPVLVVTPIKENTGTSVRLFGLIMPRSGLCQPVLLTHERIFYRWEYRASAGSRSTQRNKNWNQVIIDKARELTPPERLIANNPVPVKPGVKRKRSLESIVKKEEEEENMLLEDLFNDAELLNHDTFDLYVDLEMLFEGLVNRRQSIYIAAENAEVMTSLKLILNDENRGILRAIRQSKSSRISQQVKDGFIKVGLNSRIPDVRCRGLTHFAYPGKAFDRGDAEMVVQEIMVFWPRFHTLRILHINSILRIKQVMSLAHQTINFEAMKEFFGSALSYVKAFPDASDAELQCKLEEIIQNSGAASATADLYFHGTDNIAMDAVFLVTLLKDMAVIHDWQDRSTRAMRSTHYPGTFTSMDIEHYLNVESTEEAANKLPSHMRSLVEYAQSRACDVADVLLWLERLRLRIRQVIAE